MPCKVTQIFLWTQKTSRFREHVPSERSDEDVREIGGVAILLELNL